MSIMLSLLWSFCKIGFTSFGGLSMIPLINSEMLQHHWMTASEVADIVAIAEMTPGPLGLNCATFAGMRVAGILGALVANIGILMPTFTICAIVAIFFERFKNSAGLKQMMLGVRPVCIGLIIAVILNLSRTNYFSDNQIQWNSVVIGAIALYLLIKRMWTIPKVIIISAILGVIFWII